MYLGHDFEAELDEAVNGLKSTTEQPMGDGFGKDLMKKIFTMQLEIHAAAQVTCFVFSIRFLFVLFSGVLLIIKFTSLSLPLSHLAV